MSAVVSKQNDVVRRDTCTDTTWSNVSLALSHRVFVVQPSPRYDLNRQKLSLVEHLHLCFWETVSINISSTEAGEGEYNSFNEAF